MSNGAVEGIGVLERAVELTKAGISFVMATVVWRQGPSSGQRGSRAIVTADGAIYGWIGGACAEPVLIREAKAVLRDGEAKLIWLGQDSDFLGLHIPEGVVTIPISCQSDGALQIFIEPVKVSPQLLIVGRSPMALTLSNLAQDLDWSVEIVDGDDLTASMVRPSSVVVIATQGHGDEDALEIALENNPRFVGLVASSKRGAVVLEYLVDRGLSPAKLKKIKCPVLVLAGDDEPFNSKMTFEMYEAIPNGRLAVIPGASHAVVNEKTKLMQEVIKDFYKTLDFPITKMPNRRAKQQAKILRNS